jgi:hypothetical protein
MMESAFFGIEASINSSSQSLQQCWHCKEVFRD